MFIGLFPHKSVKLCHEGMLKGKVMKPDTVDWGDWSNSRSIRPSVSRYRMDGRLGDNHSHCGHSKKGRNCKCIRPEILLQIWMYGFLEVERYWNVWFYLRILWDAPEFDFITEHRHETVLIGSSEENIRSLFFLFPTSLLQLCYKSIKVYQMKVLS